MTISQLNLVAAASADDETKQSVIDILEKTLVEARDGKIIGLFIVQREFGHDWSLRSSSSFNLSEEIGALQMLIYERLKQSDEVD